MLHTTNLGDEFVETALLKPMAEVRSARSFRQLKDSDPMRFGPHEGKCMMDVPASYLDYLRDADWLSKWPAVEDYIERNASAIDKELDDRDKSRDWY